MTRNRSTSAQSADEGDNFDRILRVLRRQIGRERSTTTIRLEPENFGKLRLDLDLRRDALALRIAPTTDLAHRLLRDDLDKLKLGLEAAGIQLQRIEIQPPPAPDGSERGGTQDDSAQYNGGAPNSGRQRHDNSGTDSHKAPDEPALPLERTSAATRLNLVA